MNRWPIASMGEVAPLVRRPIDVVEDATYQEIGIRSFAKGVFHKAPVRGLELGRKRVFAIKAGDLLFNIVFAWEGAVAVATPNEAGMIGSHRFLTCVTKLEVADPLFLFWWFSRGEGQEQLLRASPGGAGRNRTLGIDKLSAIKVPLPPLAEQKRIVARIEAVAGKMGEVRRLRNEARKQTDALVASTHAALARSEPEPLSNFLELHEEAVSIEANVPYPQAGVRGFGGGLFGKLPVLGGQTTYRTFNRLYPGALVMSQVKGWEGAVAMTPSELANYFVSPEYRTFRCKPDRCLTEYIAALIRTEFFWGRLKDATRGVGARRERTRPEQFLELKFSMPTASDQRRALSIFATIRSIQALQAKTVAELDAVIPAILDKEFSARL